MQVVMIASKDSTDPIALSCRSVTVATPTPKRSTLRESWMYRLQNLVRNMIRWSLINCTEDVMMYQYTNLNFFLKKRVSKITVQGIMASFVIWTKRAFLA